MENVVLVWSIGMPGSAAGCLNCIRQEVSAVIVR